MATGNAGGRPRIPTVLKKLRGTLQPCRTNKLEPNPEVQIPEMPETLKGTDAGSWETLGKKLKAMGVITDMDQMAFELLCGVYAEYVALRSVLWVEDVSRPVNNQQLTTTNNNKRFSVLPPLPLLPFVVENCHYLPSSGPFLALFWLQNTPTNIPLHISVVYPHTQHSNWFLNTISNRC